MCIHQTTEPGEKKEKKQKQIVLKRDTENSAVRV